MPAFTQIKRNGAGQSVIWATAGSGLSNGSTMTLSGLTNLNNPGSGGNLADRIKAVYDTTTTYYVINFSAGGGQDEWKLSTSEGGGEVDPSTITGNPGAACQNSNQASYTVGGGGGGSGGGKLTVRGTGKSTVRGNGKITIK